MCVCHARQHRHHRCRRRASALASAATAKYEWFSMVYRQTVRHNTFHSPGNSRGRATGQQREPRICQVNIRAWLWHSPRVRNRLRRTYFLKCLSIFIIFRGGRVCGRCACVGACVCVGAQTISGPATAKNQLSSRVNAGYVFGWWRVRSAVFISIHS